MAKRNIVIIDEEKCNGCGLCVSSCHEGAIAIIDGKAKLVSETYCDGLGACLGKCPVDAITVEEREADEFDEAKAMEHVKKLQEASKPAHSGCGGGCPSAKVRTLDTKATSAPKAEVESGLRNWPVQLKLVPPTAPYLANADILLVADCVPFAYANFHGRYLGEKPVVIGCPKLDDPEYYVEKLSDMIRTANIKSISIVEMEVPCCKALSRIAKAAIAQSGNEVELNEEIISIDGNVL